MKKPPSRGQRLQWQENAKTRLEREREVADKRRRTLAHQAQFGPKYDWQGSKRGRKYKGWDQIHLPVNFSLSDSYGEVVKIINRLRSPRKNFVNFGAIRRLSIAASLMLAAELEVNKIRSKVSHMEAYDAAWDPQVRELLKQMGFLELLDAPSEVQESSDMDNSQVFVKFKSDDRLIGGGIRRITRDVTKLVASGEIPPQLRIPLNNGMAETITNTHNYAYKEKDELNRWWISASVNRNTGEITVVCYDRGQTIPKTIWDSKKKKAKYEKWAHRIKRAMGVCDDHGIILHALQEGQSSTGKRNHGKGLPSLMDLIEQNGQGVLKIYSGRGRVKYELGGDEEDVYSSDLLSCEMPGTLVEWSIIPPNPKGGQQWLLN